MDKKYGNTLKAPKKYFYAARFTILVETGCVIVSYLQDRALIILLAPRLRHHSVCLEETDNIFFRKKMILLVALEFCENILYSITSKIHGKIAE